MPFKKIIGVDVTILFEDDKGERTARPIQLNGVGPAINYLQKFIMTEEERERELIASQEADSIDRESH